MSVYVEIYKFDITPVLQREKGSLLQLREHWFTASFWIELNWKKRRNVSVAKFEEKIRSFFLSFFSFPVICIIDLIISIISIIHIKRYNITNNKERQISIYNLWLSIVKRLRTVRVLHTVKRLSLLLLGHSTEKENVIKLWQKNYASL